VVVCGGLAEMRWLHRREGLGIKTIARTSGISRNTVRAPIESDARPRSPRKPAGLTVDAFDNAIRTQLQLVPTMSAMVIAERVGWTWPDGRVHAVQRGLPLAMMLTDDRGRARDAAEIGVGCASSERGSGAHAQPAGASGVARRCARRDARTGSTTR